MTETQWMTLLATAINFYNPVVYESHCPASGGGLEEK